MDLTPKQQTSEAIRQADTILIITGQHPSVDQASAVVALAGILRKFGKKVSAIVSDNPPAAVQTLEAASVERGLGGSRDFILKLDVTKVEVDKLRYEVQDGKLNIYLTPFKGSFAPSDVTFGYGGFQYDLAIVLGVPTRARIDRIYEQNSASFETIPMVNLDFHRSNENYGAVNLIEPNASSLCEMLVALSESLQSGIVDAEIATALLMGIVASTDRFTAVHTSPKSLTVAAQMMAAGARQQAVVKALYRDNRPEQRGGERDRGAQDRGERGGASQGGQQRPSNPAPMPVAQAEPKAAQTEPVVAAPAVRPVPDPVPAPEPRAPESLTPLRDDDELIIQPGHIEMSSLQPAEPVPLEQPEPVKPELEPISPLQPELVPEVNPLQPELPRLQPEERPQAMPIADFAAAAEMFSPIPATAEAKPEVEQS